MPNILICGTPGTGKSTIVEALKVRLPQLNYINLSKFAIDNKCTEEFDENLDTHVIDEAKILDLMKPLLENKDNIIEYHHADVFPEEMIDIAFVCRTDNTKLYDRLVARGYSENKITNNIDAEIFRLILDDAIEHFGQDKVIELTTNETTEIESNVSTILRKVREFQ